MACTCTVENYSYSNCGKWKVLEADAMGTYEEVDHSPDKEENSTSVEDNSDNSDNEYQSR